MTTNAQTQAAAQLDSVRAMVAALECDFDRLEELREELQAARVAGWNMPGYMPDAEPATLADPEDAREYIATELEDRADNTEDDEQAEVLRAAARLLRASSAGDDREHWGAVIAGIAYWIAPAERLEDDGDAAELEELTNAAGDCEDGDEARERILQDALEVAIRSDWYQPGQAAEPIEYRIMLCTGSPAVQIVGTLNQYNEPESAELQCQDWFTAWETVPTGADETADLLTYAQQFYFE